MEMPGRKYNPQNYRYGFNGKENDRSGEWGLGLVQDYGFRLYNPGLGRFLSVDPLRAAFPSESSYLYAGNSPIQLIDLEGGFKWPGDKKMQKEWEQRYPNITTILKDVKRLMTESPRTMAALQKYSAGQLTLDIVKKDLEYGSGPIIEPVEMSNFPGFSGYMFYDRSNPKNSKIQLSMPKLDALEALLKSDANNLEKLKGILPVYGTLIEEYTTYGDAQDGYSAIEDEYGNVSSPKRPELSYNETYRPDDNFDEGRAAKVEVLGQVAGNPDMAEQIIYRRMQGKKDWQPGNPGSKTGQRVFPEEKDPSVLPRVPSEIK